MIGLDANALYWYYGRDRLGLTSAEIIDVHYLQSVLDCTREKAITSSAFLEMIVHFRNDPKVLHDLIQFCFEKNIRIYNVPVSYCFSQFEIDQLKRFNGYVLKCYANNKYDEKIRIETNHTYVFLEIINLLFANHYINSRLGAMGQNKDRILSFIGRDWGERNRKDILLELENALRIGYDEGKPAQSLKECYMEMLTSKCYMTIMIVEAIIADSSGKTDYYSVAECAVKKEVSEGLANQSAMDYIKRMLQEDSSFLKYAENEIAQLFQKKGYSLHQSLYIRQMLEAWLERGQKLRKNDIFDMLCFGFLDLYENRTERYKAQPVLLTFDGPMRKFIGDNSYNGHYICQFKQH